MTSREPLIPPAKSSTGAPTCGSPGDPGLPHIPLLGPDAAGLDQFKGIGTGLLALNGDPPYAAKSINVIAHWLKDTPLRPAPIRSPGKPANCFAVESFFDELAAAAKLDPVAMRLKGLSDPRAIEVIKRVAATMKWDTRPSPGPDTSAAVARGRGFSFVHYKHPRPTSPWGWKWRWSARAASSRWNASYARTIAGR